jgi:hypothetical protein
VRLVEGLRTLALPTRRGPREYGNHWPDWMYEWEDLLAQQEIEQEEKDRANRKQNRTRLSPSSVEIARMERTIAWPAHYLRSFPQLLRTVQLAASARARHRDLRWVAGRLRLPGREAPEWRRARQDRPRALSRQGADFLINRAGDSILNEGGCWIMFMPSMVASGSAAILLALRRRGWAVVLLGERAGRCDHRLAQVDVMLAAPRLGLMVHSCPGPLR